MIKKIATLVALLGLLFSVSPALAAGTSGFSAEPGTASGQIDTARSRFTYQLQPGDNVSDQIYVSNTGSEPISLVIYANDAKSLSDGTFDVKNYDEAPTGVASWIQFANGKTAIEIRLAHDQSTIVPFKMQVPANAEPGDHTGGIAVSAASGGTGQIQIARRIVTRLYARVQGALTPVLSVSDFSAKYLPSFNPFGGSLVMSFTISNGGNVSLLADATTSASTIFGIPLGSTATSVVDEITPGASRSYQVVVPNVPQWFYMVPKVELQPKVDKDAINPGALLPVTRDAAIWEFPYAFVALIVLIVVAYLLIRARIQRRRRQVTQWLEFTEAEAKSRTEN